MPRIHQSSVLILFNVMAVCAVLAGCSTGIMIGPLDEGEIECGSPHQASVTRGVDGDTLAVQLPDGREEKVRILGVDTPETDDVGNRDGAFYGIADPSYLTAWGKKAGLFTADRLEGTPVTLTTDCRAGVRDRYGRILAYVATDDGQDFGTLLLREGYARVYTAESFDRKDSYIALESQARNSRAGLWSGAVTREEGKKGPVAIADVHYDAQGDDRQNLNDEYIVLTTTGGSAVDLSGWTVAESGGTTYTFGEVSVSPGTLITLHAGSGNDSAVSLYWNLSSPVLGNDGDLVILRDPAGTEADEFRWGGG